MDTTEEDVVVKAKTKRILAFDLIRGYFLLVIMIDHIELYPNGWDFFTGKGRLWVSAAEGFFFMSGLLIGLIYKRRLHLGMKFIFKKMWQRALELYVAGVGLTFVFLSWVEFTHHAPIKDTLPIPFPWHHYIKEALLTRFTYGWADFLVHFAVLMLIAPFVFYLISKGKWWLALAGMIVAWAFRGEHFTLAWQLIFNGGIIIGFYWNEIVSRFRRLSAERRRLIKRVFATLAAATFIVSYASVYILSLLNYFYGSLTPWLRHVTFTWNDYNSDIWVFADKWKVGWLRILLFLIWFPVFYWILHKYEKQIGRASRGLLELLGRNSLFVYTIHAFIVFILKMYVIPPKTNFILNFLITGSALVTVVLATIVYKRLEAWLGTIGYSKLKLTISQVFSR
ncbi:MAG TPA: OpgC domain-containing protein [Candidatus Saccharimonadales bacterium]|nr:OpgC domain-containing protein [Candidatus Saccharimonadales bacterium]